MPVVTFRHDELCRLLGRDVPLEELAERMPMIGGDLEHAGDGQITIEWFPNRPDLLPIEGTARALRAFLGIAPGMPRYDVAPAKTRLEVDRSVAAVRPHAAICYVRGVELDAAAVDALVEAQEKLVAGPGRKRRKIAIGLHDADGVEGPFRYTCVGSDDKPFVPLQGEAAMTPARIVAEHPKGREYGHLLPADRFPVFLDGSGDVISMPPVINARRTTVTTATRDLLVDVTGTDAAAVRQTIALLATALADRGGRIEAVEVQDASGTWTSPDLRTREQVLHVDDVAALLGGGLRGDEVADALRRMGHHAESYENRVLVESPAWRQDLLHPVDWMEDIAIGHGYSDFAGRLPATATLGAALGHQRLEDRARTLMLGHGFHEARTLTLSHAGDQWQAWGGEAQDAATVANPVLEEQAILRLHLVPSLLRVLAHNRHRSLPQRLFEAGHAVRDEDGAWRNRLLLAAVESTAKASFSDAKGLAAALLRDLGLDARLAPGERPGLIPGRQGTIVLGDRAAGWFGELHPDTLLAFGLAAPCVALELDLQAVHEGEHGRGD